VLVNVLPSQFRERTYRLDGEKTRAKGCGPRGESWSVRRAARLDGQWVFGMGFSGDVHFAKRTSSGRITRFFANRGLGR